ncbi:MAG TPA: hypothetical protein VIS96_14170 [Terrimicrobiaceae bacterium]
MTTTRLSKWSSETSATFSTVSSAPFKRSRRNVRIVDAESLDMAWKKKERFIAVYTALAPTEIPNLRTERRAWD